MKLLVITYSLLYFGLPIQGDSFATSNTVSFSIPKFLWTVKGTFKEVVSQCNFNPKDLNQSSISGHAIISSVDTDNSTRDGHLQGVDWFDAGHYPKIEVNSNSFEKLSPLTYKGNFTITMKGTSMEKDIQFTISDAVNPKYITASFSLKLSDFSIGSGKGVDWVVGDEVDIEVSLINYN